MSPDDRPAVCPPADAEPERPIRVLDGGRFTYAAPADVRVPRFLAPQAANAPVAARRGRRA